MTKKIIGFLMAGLIGAVPLNTSAAGNGLFVQTVKAPIMVSQQHKKDQGPKHKKEDKRDHDRREKERKEKERKEKERREKERRERERKLREERKNDSRHIIQRTAKVISAAQQSTKRGHYYKGMAQAVAHQQKACRLHRAGSYLDAIHHSLRARRIAIAVIEGNRGKWSGSWDAREEKYRRNSPKDKDLDIRIDFSKIGDKEAVRISIDLDL
ncbi:MAG: hypothetical protein GX075_13970 [Firmicutes bacterium]|nr:hypothetical protein [Bacillota bacterium]